MQDTRHACVRRAPNRNCGCTAANAPGIAAGQFALNGGVAHTNRWIAVTSRVDLSTIEAVIFDMDGLLFDTEPLIKTAKLGAIRALGFDLTDTFYDSMIGVPGPECDVRIQTHFGPTFPMADYLTSYRSDWTQRIANGVPLKAGAADIIRHFHGLDMPLGLATSSGRESASHHLHTADLHHYFRAVVTRNDVSRGKPHPDLYLKAAELIGIAPERCLALEDSHNGVRAAHAAGCQPIMVPDLLQATDEMRRLCIHVAGDLHDVRRMFVATR